MKVGITRSDFEKPYDKEIFSTLIRVLKDAGLFKNFTKKRIFNTCYGSRMQYSNSESPTRNATYWFQDLNVNDYFFAMLYKGRLIKGVLYDVVSKKNESEYRSLIDDFLTDILWIEESLEYGNINTKKQLLYEFDEIFDFIDNTGIKKVHQSIREYWGKIKTKMLCS